MSSFFAETPQFQAAVAVVNKISVADFKRVLDMLASGEEVPAKIQQVQSWIQHVVERAAAEQLKSQRLSDEMKKYIPDSHTEALLRYYQVFQQQLLKKIEHSSTVPLHLLEHNWRLHLNLAQDNFSTILDPYALFQFKLGNPHDETQKVETLTLEFSHEELYTLFLSLEDIQSQLDSLG
eukprot:TRINITY_DN7801_c0_g1_i1.p1 TRINITY_DN7801_c0_g1~~TRINITY_DN7801_c0_g1_i1.p1  ORF type:complete len:179 (+),score=27.84 TRINITY_DN7801_c0_g1_i1:57-593(+)